MKFHHFGIIVSNLKKASINLKAILPIEKKQKYLLTKDGK